MRDYLEQLAGGQQIEAEIAAFEQSAQATVTSGCAQLLTEDMQTGAVVGGMRIVNPFAG